MKYPGIEFVVKVSMFKYSGAAKNSWSLDKVSLKFAYV